MIRPVCHSRSSVETQKFESEMVKSHKLTEKTTFQWIQHSDLSKFSRQIEVVQHTSGLISTKRTTKIAKRLNHSFTKSRKKIYFEDQTGLLRNKSESCPTLESRVVVVMFVLQREDRGCQPSTTDGLQLNQPRFLKSVW